MDTEFLSRLHKYLNEFYASNIDALMVTKDAGDMRERQGVLKTILVCKEFIAEANNPQKKQENKIAEDQYNV